MAKEKNSYDEIENVEPNPMLLDTKFSYGVIEMPQPDDVLYKLSYDCQTGELKLGKNFVVKKFQWEEEGDNFFKQLFCSKDPEIKEHNKGPVKEGELPTKELGYSLVNNIKIPLSLRRAIFRTSKNGKKIQVHTEITRERAKAFKVNRKEVEIYLQRTLQARREKNTDKV